MGTITPISRPEVAPPDPGALTMKHQLILAMQQGLSEPNHSSNSGIGPDSAAWATLIVDGPYYVDVNVRHVPADREAEWNALTAAQRDRAFTSPSFR